MSNDISHLSTNEIVGKTFKQNIAGTIFYQRVLDYGNGFNGIRYFKCRNVETGFERPFSEYELKPIEDDTNTK